jgi:hypothetical protein
MIVNELTWILEIKNFNPSPKINPYSKANQILLIIRFAKKENKN